MLTNVVEEDIEHIASFDVPWEKLEGKSILVSGAAGSIPAYMIKTVMYLNETVFKTPAQIYALVRNREKAEATFKSHKGQKTLEIIEQDVCDFTSFDKKLDVIIHAASPTSPRMFYSEPAKTMMPNVIGTKNLLELAVKNKVESFLFFSTCLVYGDNSAGKVKEDIVGHLNHLEPGNSYAISKQMGEAMCIAWNVQHGVPAKIIRPFNTYGPGMNLNDGRVYTDFVADVVNNKNIIMKSAGQGIRSFCYLVDSTVGFFLVLLKGASGEAYNIGNSDCATSVVSLAETLTELFPEKKIKVIQKNDKELQEKFSASKIDVRTADTSKLEALGWNPTVTLKEGFFRTILSYKQNSDTCEKVLT